MAVNIERKSYKQEENFIGELLRRIRTSMRSKRGGRFTYVIGNNGTGKSRALAELAEGLNEVRSEKVIACIASSIHDRFKFGDHERIKYMGARNGTNAVFLAAIERKLGRYILQAMLIDRRLLHELSKAVNLELSFSVAKNSIEALRSAGAKKTRDAIRLAERAEQSGLLNARPLGMLKRIVESDGRFESLTDAQISTLIRYLDINIDMEIRFKYGEESIGFGGLSTGEQNRLLLFAKILSVLEEGTIYLIDEPELGLHLHWQMEFHRTIVNLLSRIDRFYVVVATHSPIIISEAARFDCKSDSNAVAVLSRKGLDGLRVRDYGADVGSVSFDFHSFSKVASHEQLVLRQFQTSTYQTREVSVEVADTILSVAEGEKDKAEAISILDELQHVVGLSPEAEVQISAAIRLLSRDLVKSNLELDAI